MVVQSVPDLGGVVSEILRPSGVEAEEGADEVAKVDLALGDGVVGGVGGDGVEGSVAAAGGVGAKVVGAGVWDVRDLG